MWILELSAHNSKPNPLIIQRRKTNEDRKRHERNIHQEI